MGGLKIYQLYLKYLFNGQKNKLILDIINRQKLNQLKFSYEIPSRRRMQNSLISGLLPPSPRTKARYMNIDSLIRWAAEMLLLIDNPDSLPEVEREDACLLSVE